MPEAANAANAAPAGESREDSRMADDIEGMSWYVAKAAVGFEKAARTFLEERIRQENMDEHFGEIMMPVEQVLSIGTKKTTEKKLFPGYLFIQIRTDSDGRMDDRCWHLVRRTRKISGFISGASDAPIPLSEREVKQIRRKMDELSNKEPSLQARFATGDTVRVKEGAFVDFTGTVESVNIDRSRLKVLVMVLGRATPVELDFNQVDKA
ncbi:MAG: transcription termination/antitermination protein NusG [Gammaproteobacteria bacterium]